MPLNPEGCHNCRFSLGAQGQKSPYCHRHPPIVVVVPGPNQCFPNEPNTRTEYPTAFEWCGDFEPLKEPQ